MSNGMMVFRRGNSLPHCLQEVALISSDKLVVVVDFCERLNG